MNSRLLLLILVAVVAAGAGWWARSWKLPKSSTLGADSSRRVLFYQSSMHPWIKSDQPGKCTICGMDLAPVYEGESGFAASPDLVTLNSNSITVAQVQTSPVTRGPLVRTVELAGTLESDQSQRRVLSAYTDGRLDRLHVNYEGAVVRAGEPLAQLYSPTLLAAVRDYLNLAKRQPGSGTELGLAPLKSAAASRLLQLGLLPAQIERLPDTFTETNLHVEILAPMSGTVVRRDVYEGQTVTAGQPLFELADLSTVWLMLEAYEGDLPWLQPGQAVEFTLTSRPGEIFTNRLSFIEPNFNPATRSTRVRVEVPNPSVDGPADARHRLTLQAFARARVQTESPGTLKVPRSAVLDAGRPQVFVEVSPGAYQPRAVALGRRGDTEVEIVSGVTEGEAVVTQGALLLDGQAQLNVLSRPPVAPTESSPGESMPVGPLLDEQVEVIRKFLAAADALRESLSADDLERFNLQAPGLHGAAAGLLRGLQGAAGWQDLAGVVNQKAHLNPATDLTLARREFHPLSEALVQMGRALRTQPAFSGLKVYQCPMTKRSFPGAPPKAGWIQLTAPLRNPYFGADMLDCGAEVPR